MPYLRSDAGRQSRATHRPSGPPRSGHIPPGRNRRKGEWWVGRTSRSPARAVATPLCSRVSSASSGYVPCK
eukprot:6175107-Pleurochrysis_carterae.AAC.1